MEGGVKMIRIIHFAGAKIKKGHAVAAEPFTNQQIQTIKIV
jgi:hypothetical protein